MSATIMTRAGVGAAPAADVAAAAPSAIIAGWWAVLRQRRRDRLTRRILEGLDDRTLRDIGIDRSEIASIVNTRAYGRHWPHYLVP